MNYTNEAVNLIAKKVGIVFITIVTIFAICIYARFDPEGAFFPRCPFYWASGLKCPGCGSQRALHQLLHLHILEAFHYNACLILSIPIILFLVVADLLRFRYPKLYFASHNPILSWSLLGLILLWWVVRNVFGW